jgi:hypothetical protein
MRKSRPWIRSAVTVLFGASWCGILLYLCVWCPNFSGTPTALDSVDTWGKVWMAMSGIALAYLLFLSRSSLRPFRTIGGRIRVGDLHEALYERKAMFKGLVGGLLCSFPALAITLVGLVVAVPHPDGWITDGSLSRLAAKGLADSGSLQPAPSARRAYLIGIDLSRSTIQNARDPRLQQVCRTLDALFVREPNAGFTAPIKSEDTPKFYIFAENQKPLYPENGIFGRLPNSQMSAEVCKDLGTLANQLSGGADDIGRGKTDIVKFLEDMVGRMKAQSEYAEVTLIVFSDFRQDIVLQSSRDLQERISAIMADMDALGQHMVGFSLPTDPGGAEPQSVDIRPAIEQHRWAASGEKRLWREVALDTGGKSVLDLRREISRSLYREERHSVALHLKYRTFPEWQGITSYLDLPKLPEYGRVLLALRPAQRDDAIPSGMSVALGDPKGNPTVLEMGDSVEYSPAGSDQASLPLTLFGPMDVSRSIEFDLLVIVPNRSMVHSVRLVVLPTVSHSLPIDLLRWALGLAAATFILLVVGASGTDLWLRRKLLWSARRLRFHR